ncbi:M56 family metallopeptidase [Rubripirellula reticaptiva]|uniref:BlaR1 peptidase M56 n=1 Tax=Rubripirellula reticaptiva TaxID=2528013 RepID=A0A5C6ETF7_9BACT|nr:M56 family metallopeptidase [Rubripirellula reticaptiva]TWU51367.1 BlaR1 peptidase M56 [Rubripirellula reticaptiva]
MNEMLLTEVLVGLLIQTTVVVAITFALDLWLGNSRASCRLWTVCFVGVLCLAIAGLLLPHYRMFRVPTIRPGTVLAEISLCQPTAVRIATTAWAIGFGLMLVWRLLSYVGLCVFLRRDCRPMTKDERRKLPVQVNEFGTDLRVLVCESVDGAFCWQLHYPTIVLPASLLHDSPTEQRHVILHELEHLRTNHPLQHFLQGVCRTLFWFHPMIWMAGRRAELVREFLCDEHAALACGKISSYLRTLAKIAQRSNVSPSCVLSFGRSKSALIQRSDQLVTVARRGTDNHGSAAIIGVVILASTIILTSQLWPPVNPLASTRSDWSPWPTWTAQSLHDFGIHVRDFESFDEDHGMHDLLLDD